MDIYVDTFFALSEKKVFYISELIFYTQTVKLFFPNFVLILREALQSLPSSHIRLYENNSKHPDYGKENIMRTDLGHAAAGGCDGFRSGVAGFVPQYGDKEQ